MKARTRVLLISVLLGALFAMGVHYNTTAAEHWPYPDTKQLSEEYDRYVGATTFLSGTVERIDERQRTARIRVESPEGAFRMSVHGFEANVRPGGEIQVLGELRPEHVIVAREIAVVNPMASASLYKYVVSLVGALVVVVSFFRYWRVNRDTLSFEAR